MFQATVKKDWKQHLPRFHEGNNYREGIRSEPTSAASPLHANKNLPAAGKRMEVARSSLPRSLLIRYVILHRRASEEALLVERCLHFGSQKRERRSSAF